MRNRLLRYLASPLVAATAATLPLAALADEAAQEITVTAPRPDGVPQERIAGAVSTVTAEDIADRQITRLEDALTLAPGVTVSGQRGVGLNQSVALRGLGPRNVRVFIDGIEMSDTSQSQSQYPISELTMADVERIEVLRGPQPGRFGPDAGGGVINITTKRATTPFSGEIGAEAGSYGTVRSHASVGGVQGPVDFRVSASGTRSDGYSDFNEARGGVEDDAFRQWSGSARLGIQASDDLRFDAIGRYQREDLFYDSSTADMDWNRDETERFLRLSATLDTLNDSLIHTLGVSDTKITRQYWGAGTAGDTYDGFKTRIDYVGDWRVTDSVTIQAGADATKESIEQHTPGFAPATPFMEEEFWRTGAFATVGASPLDGLDLAATVRGDDHEEFGGKATWRLSAAYTVDASATTLRTSYGTAWQTPSLYERFDPCYGAAGLQPEKTKGWDVGIDQDLVAGAVTASATYFQASTRDEIAWQWTPPTNPACAGGTYVNLNKTRVQGVETALSVRPLPTVETALSYTWQNAVDDLTDTRLRDRPMHQATGFVGWKVVPEALLSLSVRYRDETESWGAASDEFWTADFGVRYAVTETVTLHGRVENLLDASYEEQAGYGTPGRSAYAGATVRF